MDDLEERVFGALPDGTWVYPGHGKDTTLGAERPHVAEWRDAGLVAPPPWPGAGTGREWRWPRGHGRAGQRIWAA